MVIDNAHDMVLLAILLLGTSLLGTAFHDFVNG